MNIYEEFAAERAERLVSADDEMRPLVTSALAGGAKDWDDVVTGASVLWLEIFSRESPNADPERSMEAFQKLLRDSLAKTATPSDPPDPVQVERVTLWVGTLAVNDATFRAARARGERQMRWVTMHDEAVRATHRAADGQERSTDGTFDIGGYELRYPGEPVGPPEIWINCRCLVYVGRTEGNASMAVEEVVKEAELLPDEETEVTEIADGEPLVDDVVEIPWHAVLAPEGVPTGDGRQFGVGALSVRNLPLPISYQDVSQDGHLGSVVIGKMTEAWKDEATGTWRARGTFWSGEPLANKVIDGIVGGFLGGLSVDVDDIEVQMSDDPDEALEQMMGGGTTVFSKARIMGATVVAHPAFQEAYIALGPEFDDELSEADANALVACGCAQHIEYDEIPELDQALVASVSFAPGTKDGPGWITHPQATARIRRYWVRGKGAAKIAWGTPGDFNRCRVQLGKYVQNPDWLAGLCANMHKEAIGVWPGQEAGGRHSVQTDPKSMLSIVASSALMYPASDFANPNFTKLTPLTVTDDGRVFGHLAEWGTCHLGISGVCTTAPYSTNDYGYFKTGVIQTDEGQIRVGKLTYATGHAGLALDAVAATAHYDQPDAVRAYVNVGEDTFGIWFSGVLRPGLTAEELTTFQANGALSGDWRYVGGGMELVAATAVVSPGYALRPALAASGGHQTALVAAGVVYSQPTGAPVVMDADTVAAISRNAVAEYLHQTKMAEKANELRTKARARYAATVRGKMKEN